MQNRFSKETITSENGIEECPQHANLVKEIIREESVLVIMTVSIKRVTHPKISCFIPHAAEPTKKRPRVRRCQGPQPSARTYYRNITLPAFMTGADRMGTTPHATTTATLAHWQQCENQRFYFIWNFYNNYARCQNLIFCVLYILT